jgi:hypothetical protein
LFEVEEDIRQIYDQLQQQEHFNRHHQSRNCSPFHQYDSLLASSPKKTQNGTKGHKATGFWDHSNNKDKPSISRFHKSRENYRPSPCSNPHSSHPTMLPSKQLLLLLQNLPALTVTVQITMKPIAIANQQIFPTIHSSNQSK